MCQVFSWPWGATRHSDCPPKELQPHQGRQEIEELQPTVTCASSIGNSSQREDSSPSTENSTQTEISEARIPQHTYKATMKHHFKQFYKAVLSPCKAKVKIQTQGNEPRTHLSSLQEEHANLSSGGLASNPLEG